MKRFISVLLIMLMCMSLAACGGEKPADKPDTEVQLETETQNGGIEGSGESDKNTVKDNEKPADSKSQGDMVHFEVEAENMSGDGFFIRPVRKDEDKEYKKLLESCEDEIEILSKAESYEKYFGEKIKDEDGEIIKYSQILEDVKLEDRNIFEYCPIIAGGFKEGCGEVTAQMLFATPYDEDEEVAVMIGIVTENADKTRSIEWYAFEGEGMELNSNKPEANGRIKVELSEEIVLMIQEKTALLAIISD